MLQRVQVRCIRNQSLSAITIVSQWSVMAIAIIDLRTFTVINCNTCMFNSNPYDFFQTTAHQPTTICQNFTMKFIASQYS